MMGEITEPFLPLGSMLRLKEGEDEQHLYMIVARAIAKSDEETITSRYRVAAHSFGNIATKE